jgi:hypothetical protein
LLTKLKDVEYMLLEATPIVFFFFSSFFMDLFLENPKYFYRGGERAQISVI